MSEFNRMTVVAAAEVITSCTAHSDMQVLETQWGIVGKCDVSSKPARAADIAAIAINKNPQVMMEQGRLSLSRALVETAISHRFSHKAAAWSKLIAGLRFDGFELIQEERVIPNQAGWNQGQTETIFKLARMLPEDIPGVDFRDAESEVETLLAQSGFSTAMGHLERATSTFQRGEWSAANGELRNFYENFLNEIAVALGCSKSATSEHKRRYLAMETEPPFLLEKYNEWSSHDNKSHFIQSLMNRMHPEGGHPGLSEEEDATFRLQITLVTARLFLRRFNQRMTS